MSTWFFIVLSVSRFFFLIKKLYKNRVLTFFICFFVLFVLRSSWNRWLIIICLIIEEINWTVAAVIKKKTYWLRFSDERSWNMLCINIVCVCGVSFDMLTSKLFRTFERDRETEREREKLNNYYYYFIFCEFNRANEEKKIFFSSYFVIMLMLLFFLHHNHIILSEIFFLLSFISIIKPNRANIRLFFIYIFLN